MKKCRKFHIFINIELSKNITHALLQLSKTEKKSLLSMMYIYSSFSPFNLPPLVEWYVNDIDKS